MITFRLILGIKKIIVFVVVLLPLFQILVHFAGIMGNQKISKKKNREKKKFNKINSDNRKRENGIKMSRRKIEKRTNFTRSSPKF